MKKELRHIITIIVAAVIGGIVGYILGKIQIHQLQDPSFIQQLMSHNMMIHEPIGTFNSMMLGICIFAGVATGLIIYNHFACKLTLLMRVIIGILIFPFYSIFGMVGVILYFIYNIVLLFKNK